MEFLTSLLERDGHIVAAQLKAEARAAGIAIDTLWRVAERIGGPEWASGERWTER